MKPAKYSCRSHHDLTSRPFEAHGRRSTRTSFRVTLCSRSGDANSVGSPDLVAPHPWDGHATSSALPVEDI
jgi:hypothetical protein